MADDVGLGELQAALERGDRVIDVREDDEYVSGHVAGVEHVPMRTVPGRLAELVGDGSVYVVCEVGGRSAMVVDYLADNGIQALNVAGGMAAWRRSGFPMETGRPN
jgi:rhodanese-related sulfurtransferase